MYCTGGKTQMLRYPAQSIDWTHLSSLHTSRMGPSDEYGHACKLTPYMVSTITAPMSMPAVAACCHTNCPERPACCSFPVGLACWACHQRFGRL
mmetsp:Transcript_16874/g.36533  ORF Transcript_16874/g.36533 Transcript_16874/m.36533 type:complete len:94 (+) Transcript_16874:1372-1653(+)